MLLGSIQYVLIVCKAAQAREDLGRRQRQVFLGDLEQEVRVELLKVLDAERQTLQGGKVRVHRVV